MGILSTLLSSGFPTRATTVGLVRWCPKRCGWLPLRRQKAVSGQRDGAPPARRGGGLPDAALVVPRRLEEVGGEQPQASPRLPQTVLLASGGGHRRPGGPDATPGGGRPAGGLCRAGRAPWPRSLPPQQRWQLLANIGRQGQVAARGCGPAAGPTWRDGTPAARTDAAAIPAGRVPCGRGVDFFACRRGWR